VSTGDLDLCYYNYRCAQPVGPFLDFNHLVFNVPYMMFGLGFIRLVYGHAAKLEEIANGKDNIGIPSNCGLLKALGVALIMEGLLSLSYHLCPNEATFQFGTTLIKFKNTMCEKYLFKV